VGPLTDVFQTKIIELNGQNFIKNIQQSLHINEL